MPIQIFLMPRPPFPTLSVLGTSSPTGSTLDLEDGSGKRSPTALCSCQDRRDWRETLLNFLSCHWQMNTRFHYCPFCGLPLPAANEDTVWGPDR